MEIRFSMEGFSIEKMETFLQTNEPEVYRILTNNEDRVLCTLRCLIGSKMDNPVFKNTEGKSSQKTIEWIKTGNEEFSRSQLNPSCYAYSRAIMCAIPGSKDLARAYANRSAVTCEMTMYGHSLKDIDRALAIGYPDNLKAKLYIRQAKCLWAVNGKMCPEIKASIETAEKWITKLDECNRNKLQTAVNNMKTPDFLKTLNLEETLPMDGRFMPEPPMDNPKIPRASGSVELRHSDELGPYLAAARDISAGQVLFVDKSFTSVPTIEPERQRFTPACCCNCSKSIIATIPCLQCVYMSYCDEKCRDEDWNNYHQLDCPIINQLMLLPTHIELFLALRMSIKAFKEAGSFQRLKKHLHRIDSIADPVEKFFEENVLNSSKYASVYSLVNDSTPCPFNQTIHAVYILKLLAGLTNMFGKKMYTIADIIDHEWTIFMGSIVLRNLQITNKRLYHQFLFVRNGLHRSLAFGVHPLVGLCHHSCDANAGIYYRGNVSALMALQRIPRGQQILISYADINFQRFSKNIRRKKLQDMYEFRCNCIACTNNWEISAMKSCKVLSMPREKYQELQSLLERFHMLYQPSSVIQSLPEQIVIMKDILNIFDVSLQNSCAEFFDFKDKLESLYKELSN